MRVVLLSRQFDRAGLEVLEVLARAPGCDLVGPWCCRPCAGPRRIDGVSVGLSLDQDCPAARHVADSSVLAASRPGTIGRLPDLEETQHRFDHVWDVRWTVSPGDPVAPRTDSGSMLGLVLFDCDDRLADEDRCRALQRWVDDEIVKEQPS